MESLINHGVDFLRLVAGRKGEKAQKSTAFLFEFHVNPGLKPRVKLLTGFWTTSPRWLAYFSFAGKSLVVSNQQLNYPNQWSNNSATCASTISLYTFLLSRFRTFKFCSSCSRAWQTFSYFVSSSCKASLIVLYSISLKTMYKTKKKILNHSNGLIRICIRKPSLFP